jgi:hypothetical protein
MVTFFCSSVHNGHKHNYSRTDTYGSTTSCQFVVRLQLEAEALCQGIGEGGIGAILLRVSILRLDVIFRKISLDNTTADSRLKKEGHQIQHESKQQKTKAFRRQL